MRKELLGAFTYLELGATLAAFIPVMAASHLRHKGDAVPRIQGRWLRRMGRVATSLTPLWRFRVVGDAPPDIATRAYVVVANHQSNADPFLLSHLPWDMRWIAKEELFRAPVVGRLMRWSGDIALRRGDAESARETMSEARATLDRGLSVMIFPEGTRSRDGQLKAFKDGAFRLAIEAHVPILPVAVNGTRDCMPTKSIALNAADATATILEPIDTRGMTQADVEKLKQMARTRIAAALPA